MSAIASSTVSTVPSATAFLSSSTVTARTLGTRARRPASARASWRARAHRRLGTDLFLEVGLAHLAGEVLAGGRHPTDPGQQGHDTDHERRVVERLPAEFVVPGHRQ